MLILMVALLLPFYSCERQRDLFQSGREPIYVIPNAGQDVPLIGSGSEGVAGRSTDVLRRLRLPIIPNDYIVSDVLDTNLDDDEGEEQIIVFKRLSDRKDIIRLLIADFDPLLNRYVHAWEEKTSANNIGIFNIEVMDVTGDANREIVSFGVDTEGDKTLDIYRRNLASTLSTLSYVQIASFTSNTGIEIERLAGRDFPVIVYEQRDMEENDSDDTSGIALQRTTYEWNALETSYEETASESIATGRIEREQLAALFDGNIQEFRQFLDGPWIREEPSLEETVAFFNVGHKTIDLFQGSTLESYDWLRSFKTSLQGAPVLLVGMRSETLDTITKQAFVTALSVDLIRLAVENDETWDGTYRKMTGDERRNSQGSRRLLSTIALDGLYTNDSGFEIYFSNPRFILREEEREYTGHYTLYKLDTHVLEINILDRNGIQIDDRVYRIDWEERVSNNQVVRIIRLSPAVVQIDGLRIIGNLVVHLEQIIDLLPVSQ